MRIRDIIDLIDACSVACAEDNTADAAEMLDEVKPSGSLTADEWRKVSNKRQRIARQRGDEVARHARRMRDLASRTAGS